MGLWAEWDYGQSGIMDRFNRFKTLVCEHAQLGHLPQRGFVDTTRLKTLVCEHAHYPYHVLIMIAEWQDRFTALSNTTRVLQWLLLVK